MDIVSRLKTFINYLGIPVTQFADTCKIPRPTLSQLLNGRNKKVSDELIRKLHTEYPSLNVVWLMFGEGNMLTDSDIKISEPQNPGLFEFQETHQSEPESVTTKIEFDETIQPSEPEKSEEPNKQELHSLKPAPRPEVMALSRDSSKTIVNIIVYYSDNSFESFIPGSPQ